jgi:hypothetical protein
VNEVANARRLGIAASICSRRLSSTMRGRSPAADFDLADEERQTR